VGKLIGAMVGVRERGRGRGLPRLIRIFAMLWSLVDLPRVPDGRVGCPALLGGVGGANKQVSTLWETAFWVLAHCILAIGRDGGRFGRGKNIFG